MFRTLKSCEVSNPLVSVVMPVFNESDCIEATISDLKNQSLKNVEFIIVDDGSTDDSLEKVLKLTNKDDRFAVISQKQSFAGVARNNGFSISKGEYVIFLDADDSFDREMLEKTYTKISEDQSDILLFEYERLNKITKTIVKEGFNKTLKYPLSIENISKQIFQITKPMPWNKLYRSAFLRNENICFQPLAFANDLYFVYMTLALAKKISSLDEVLMRYTIFFQGSLSASREKDPLLFLQAYKELRSSLIERGLFEKCFNSYRNSLNSSILWTGKVIKDKRSYFNKISKCTFLLSMGLSYDFDGKDIVLSPSARKYRLPGKNKITNFFEGNDFRSSYVYQIIKRIYTFLSK